MAEDSYYWSEAGLRSVLWVLKFKSAWVRWRRKRRRRRSGQFTLCTWCLRVWMNLEFDFDSVASVQKCRAQGGMWWLFHQTVSESIARRRDWMTRVFSKRKLALPQSVFTRGGTFTQTGSSFISCQQIRPRLRSFRTGAKRSPERHRTGFWKWEK